METKKTPDIYLQMGGKAMRITDQELALIKKSFADNDELLKIIRKIFVPTWDPDAPLGQVIDMWQLVKIDDMLPEQAIINIKSMKMLIDHIEMNLLQLKTLAGMKTETVEETKARLLQNSSK